MGVAMHLQALAQPQAAAARRMAACSGGAPPSRLSRPQAP
jgi:hypothetical protein